jgi:hypothetical protein
MNGFTPFAWVFERDRHGVISYRTASGAPSLRSGADEGVRRYTIPDITIASVGVAALRLDSRGGCPYTASALFLHGRFGCLYIETTNPRIPATKSIARLVARAISMSFLPSIRRIPPVQPSKPDSWEKCTAIQQ